MWSNKYIGIPYTEKGRDFNGVDCWGLLRLVYKEEFAIDLPSFVSDYEQSDTLRIQDLIAQYKEGWEQLDVPESGSAVLFRILGTESHVGVAISETHFVHAREGQSVTVESFSSPGWKNRIIGHFKYQEKSPAILNVVPHPLRTERFTVPVPPGTTVLQLADWVTKEYEIAPELKPKITILVNGRVVDHADWQTTKLKDSDSIQYRAVPTGGGNRTFAFIAMIGIALVAPYVVAGLGGYGATAVGVKAATAAMGTLAFTASTMAVSLVGSALVNAIAPIRPDTSIDRPDPGSTERQLMVNGAANQASPYEAIPVILGKVRVTPPLGAQSFVTYSSGRDTYLNMLLVWGYGPLTIDRDTLRIGQIDFDDYEYTTLQTLDRKTTPTATELAAFNAIYGSDIDQVNKNITLACIGSPQATVAPGPYTEIAQTNTDLNNRVEVAIHFPQGLRQIVTKGSEAGASGSASVTLEYQVKLWNSTTNAWGDWQPWKIETYTNNAKDAYTQTETYIPVGGPARMQIQVRRTTGADTEAIDSLRYCHEVQVLNASFISNKTPATDPLNCTIAKTALRIKATEQLSSQIEGINAVVQTYCNSYDTQTSQWLLASTNNPADLFRYVLQHPANPQRILDADVSSKIDLAQLQYWAGYCKNKGFEYNSVLGSQRSVLDVLRDICAAGRASPAMVDGKWTIVIDEPKDTVIQYFTPHNSWGFEGSRGLPRLPDGLKINYYDEAKDYQEAQTIIYAAGKSGANAELFESISLPGVTKASSVEDHARWHMAQAQLRRESYVLNTDIEFIVCNRGDRVKVTHDVPQWGLASGRIKSTIDRSIFDLTEYVPITNAVSNDKTYTMRVRNSAGGSTTWTIKKQWTISAIARQSNLVTITVGAHPITVGDTVTVGATTNTVINTLLAEVTAITATTFSYRLVGDAISQISDTGTVKLTDGNYDRVQFTTTSLITQINDDDLFLYGEIGTETQDLIVMGIEPTSSKTARISLVDYGVNTDYNIFTGYLTLTSLTKFNTNITKSPVNLTNSFTSTDLPTITNLQSDDAVTEILSPGTYLYNIKLSFINPSIDKLPINVGTVQCQYGYSNSTDASSYRVVSVNYLTNTIVIPNVLKGETYKIRLRYVTTDGRSGPWGTFNNHTVMGKVTNYGEVSSITVKRVSRYLQITPAISPVPADFKHFEIRIKKYTTPVSGTPDVWDLTDTQSYTTTNTASVDLKNFTIPRLSTTGVQYIIACRAMDSVNNISKTSSKTSITLLTIT